MCARLLVDSQPNIMGAAVFLLEIGIMYVLFSMCIVCMYERVCLKCGELQNLQEITLLGSSFCSKRLQLCC